MKYIPVKISTFLYKEDTITCTLCVVKSIGGKRQCIFPVVHKIKDSKKPSKRESKKKMEAAKNFGKKGWLECRTETQS